MIVQVNFLQKLLNNHLQLHILSFIHVFKAQKKKWLTKRTIQIVNFSVQPFPSSDVKEKGRVL